MPVPSTPTSLTATATGRDNIRLAWSDGANTDALLIYRHTADVFASASVIGSVVVGAQLYSDSGVNAGTAYYYWLLPLGSGGVGAQTSSATATTIGNAGNIGSDIVNQIVTAAKARLVSVLSSDFEQLKWVKDPKKNERIPWGWGVDIGEEIPSEASVFGSYTADLSLIVLLYRNPKGIVSDRDTETATLTLEQWKDRIHREFTTTRLYESDVIVRIGDPTVTPEYLEDAEVATLKMVFPVIYRNSRA